MTIAYLTRSWHVVHFDFGPDFADQLSPQLPRVLHVRLAPDYRTTTPAWLVTPELLANLCYRVDSANAAAPPGDSESLRRLERWFDVQNALAGLWERFRGMAECTLEEHQQAGGVPNLPSAPVLPVLRRVGEADVLTPWDSPEAEGWYEGVGTGRVTEEDLAKLVERIDVAMASGAVKIANHATYGGKSASKNNRIPIRPVKSIAGTPLFGEEEAF